MATIIPDASIEGLQITNQAANGIRDSVQTIANMIHAKRLDDLATARQFMDMASKVDRPELQYDAFGMMGLDKDYAKSITDNKQAQTINSMVPDENGNFSLSGNGPEMQAEINRRFNGLISNAVKGGDYVSAQQYSDARDNEISLLAQRFDKQAPAGRGANYLSLARRGGASGSRPMKYTVVNKNSGKRELFVTYNGKSFSNPDSRDKAFAIEFGKRAVDYDPSSIQMQDERQMTKDIEDEREYAEMASAEAARKGIKKKGIWDSITETVGLGNFEADAKAEIESNPYLKAVVMPDGSVMAVAKEYRVPGYENTANVANSSTGSGGLLEAYYDSKNVKAEPTVDQKKKQQIAKKDQNIQWEESRKKAQEAYDKANEATLERQLKGEINYARDEKYKKDVAKRKQQRKTEAIYDAVNKQVNQWIKDGFGASMTRKQLEAEAYRQLGLTMPNEIQTAPRGGEKVRLNY